MRWVLYAHQTAPPQTKGHVYRHVKLIVQSSVHWYAKLCPTWGRHVIICSGCNNGRCNGLFVRMDDERLVVAMVLMQGAGIRRIVSSRQKLVELGGYGTAS